VDRSLTRISFQNTRLDGVLARSDCPWAPHARGGAFAKTMCAHRFGRRRAPPSGAHACQLTRQRHRIAGSHGLLVRNTFVGREVDHLDPFRLRNGSPNHVPAARITAPGVSRSLQAGHDVKREVCPAGGPGIGLFVGNIDCHSCLGCLMDLPTLSSRVRFSCEPHNSRPGPGLSELSWPSCRDLAASKDAAERFHRGQVVKPHVVCSESWQQNGSTAPLRNGPANDTRAADLPKLGSDGDSRPARPVGPSRVRARIRRHDACASFWQTTGTTPSSPRPGADRRIWADTSFRLSSHDPLSLSCRLWKSKCSVG
jgi:hypothetical protein